MRSFNQLNIHRLRKPSSFDYILGPINETLSQYLPMTQLMHKAGVGFLGLLLLGLTACSTTESVTQESSSPDLERLEAIYRARQEQDKNKYVQADVDFMTGMIGHHAQALIMSGMAPENGANPEIQRLAARIINAQNDEIATMLKWLGDRNETVPEVHLDGLSVMLHGVEAHHAHMPGMLSMEQMKELQNARGKDYDRLFLTYMIQHHQGAVSMVKDLFATDGAGIDDTSFKLASDIQVDQLTEIARMELMLEALSN